MTKEEAIHEIEKVFEPAFANYIITALTEGATSSDEEQQSCEDAISRQAVLDLVNADWKYENLESDIANLPSVTPQPKTGRWINNKCDKCGASRPPLFDNYCPNCGAKMEV